MSLGWHQDSSGFQPRYPTLEISALLVSRHVQAGTLLANLMLTESKEVTPHTIERMDS
jgi:hypothetical protein